MTVMLLVCTCLSINISMYDARARALSQFHRFMTAIGSQTHGRHLSIYLFRSVVDGDGGANKVVSLSLSLFSVGMELGTHHVLGS